MMSKENQGGYKPIIAQYWNDIHVKIYKSFADLVNLGYNLTNIVTAEIVEVSNQATCNINNSQVMEPLLPSQTTFPLPKVSSSLRILEQNQKYSLKRLALLNLKHQTGPLWHITI